MSATSGGNAELRFKGMLARVFSDAVLDDAEKEELVAAIKTSGLTEAQMTQTIAAFLATTFKHAAADGVITDRERTRLRAIAALIAELGLPEASVPENVRRALTE